MRKAAIVLVAIVLLSLAPAISMPTSATTTPPSLNELRQAATDAYNYLIKLKRSINNYAFIAEYPSVVVTVVGYTLYDGEYVKLYFIPGVAYFDDNTNLRSKAVVRDSSISNSYYGVYYTQYMDLIIGYPEPDAVYGTTYVDVKVATLKITEYRGYPYSYVSIKVETCDPLLDGSIYVFGSYVGEVSDSTVGNIYTKQISDSPQPAMRTSVRHVDVVASLAFKNLVGVYEHQDLYMFVQNIMYNVLGNSNEYDIYNGIFTDFIYKGRIESPRDLHFYDAHWFSDGLGYHKIWNIFESRNLIFTTYPVYPYKSKIVSFAETYHQNGGAYFLTALLILEDPLYFAWWGLYYTAVGDWDSALDIWNNRILPLWDGSGINFKPNGAYSTVRLAVALALGSILAGHGYIDWTVPDEMANVLLQLQWRTGSGHYSPDGQTVYWITKPDHIGGFMVSYDTINSYGFVPFRPSYAEYLLDKGTIMDPEYLGPIPTNAETTLISLVAIAQYAYQRYGWPPGQLLLS